MASPWSAEGKGVDDLCARLSQNDPTLTSLTILAGRRFGTRVRCRQSITELTTCCRSARPVL